VEEILMNLSKVNSFDKLKIFSADLMNPFLYPSSSYELGFGINIMQSKSFTFSAGLSSDSQSQLM